LTLILAGGGLGPYIDSLKIINLIKEADLVYVDTYTSPNSQWLLKEAEKIGGKLKVKEAPRRLLEDEVYKIIELAKKQKILILTPGDPLIATTHISIIVEASRRGVDWKVIPGTSGVIAAMTASGLQFYRFGKSITVPGPWRAVKAYSVVEGIYCNLEKGLHTLLLLDYIEGKVLEPWEAAKAIIITISIIAAIPAPATMNCMNPLSKNMDTVMVEEALPIR
jgi:diphthine synthase